MSEDCDRQMSKYSNEDKNFHYVRGERDGYRAILSKASALASEEMDGLLGNG